MTILQIIRKIYKKYIFSKIVFLKVQKEKYPPKDASKEGETAKTTPFG